MANAHRTPGVELANIYLGVHLENKISAGGSHSSLAFKKVLGEDETINVRVGPVFRGYFVFKEPRLERLDRVFCVITV